MPFECHPPKSNYSSQDRTEKHLATVFVAPSKYVLQASMWRTEGKSGCKYEEVQFFEKQHIFTQKIMEFVEENQGIHELQSNLSTQRF